MTINTVEVVSNDNNRRVTYRGQDQNLVWHTYGPCPFRPGDADPTVPANWDIAGKIERTLANREMRQWLSGELVVQDFEHATVAELVDRIRSAYRDSRQERTYELAKRLLDGYNAGEYTAAQLRNAFGMDTAQFNTFVTKVTGYAAEWDALQLVEGE